MNIKMFLLITIIIFAFFGEIEAQTVADFEDIQLPPESYINDGGVDEGFFSGNTFLPNDYNADWDAWTGWAISNTTDTQDASYNNQYSSISGHGVNESANYAVTYAYDGSIIHFSGTAKGGDIEGLYITNSTVTYLSILNGDAIAKRFGGESGDDPDFFKLVIRCYLDGNVSSDSIEYYLADYRFSDNSQDYIVNTWQYIDLQSLGKSDSLVFVLRSSDNGIFGMNTPAYFCIDNLTTLDNGVSNSTEGYGDRILVYHDHTGDQLIIQAESFGSFQYMLADINGQILSQDQFRDYNHVIGTHKFSTGTYFLSLNDMDRGSRKTYRFIKH
jgi:hypothetical protein